MTDANLSVSVPALFESTGNDEKSRSLATNELNCNVTSLRMVMIQSTKTAAQCPLKIRYLAEPWAGCIEGMPGEEDCASASTRLRPGDCPVGGTSCTLNLPPIAATAAASVMFSSGGHCARPIFRGRCLVGAVDVAKRPAVVINSRRARRLGTQEKYLLAKVDCGCAQRVLFSPEAGGGHAGQVGRLEKAAVRGFVTAGSGVCSIHPRQVYATPM